MGRGTGSGERIRTEGAARTIEKLSCSPPLNTEALRGSQSAIRNPQSEIGSSEPVTGDRAFNYGIWATQRMLAYEAMREQTQVKAEQANTQQKELAPIQNTVSISNITQQAMSQNLQQTSSPVQLSPSSQNYPSYQMNSNNSYNNSMNMWMMSYMQQMSQQRSFNEFIYYQQKSYNNYNSVLNSRGPAAR